MNLMIDPHQPCTRSTWLAPPCPGMWLAEETVVKLSRPPEKMRLGSGNRHIATGWFYHGSGTFARLTVKVLPSRNVVIVVTSMGRRNSHQKHFVGQLNQGYALGLVMLPSWFVFFFPPVRLLLIRSMGRSKRGLTPQASEEEKENLLRAKTVLAGM